MKLEVGLKFQKYYSKDNINNVPYVEVIGIIKEHSLIILLCRNKDKKQGYEMITNTTFDYFKDAGSFMPLKQPS